MSTLEAQVIKHIYGQPDDILRTVLDYLENNSTNLPEHIDRSRMTQSGIQRIGIAENEFVYDHEYDFDEDNDKIAEMFGVRI